MKGPLLILVFLPTFINAQQLPEIQSNVSNNKSEMWIEFKNKYDQILSFTSSSYWSTQKIYIIYGQTNGKWERIKWTLKLDDNKRPVRSKIRKISFKQDEFQELLAFLDSLNFWEFDLDSLNLQKEIREDGSGTLWMKTDGTTDSFEVIKNGQHRLISSYEPEYFQKLIPVEQRRKFIDCRNKFLKLNKSN